MKFYLSIFIVLLTNVLSANAQQKIELRNYLNRLANMKTESLQITGCIIGYVDVSSFSTQQDRGYVADVVYDTKLEFTPEGY